MLSDDDNESLADYPSQSVASSGKRQRLNDHDEDEVKTARSISLNIADTAQESDGGPVLPDSYRSSAPNGTDGTVPAAQKHQPGSIVRVTLKNFVTYTNAEFFPGPSLNMVIGPNGTGKSTLVCAICLGLGWRTEHLGRAKNIGEFVKHGSKDAEIEIELAGDPARHDSNPVIKHHIKKEGDKSNFYINGKSEARKHVVELCRSFAIQVDNLCQFLPQDRVVEFAALSPEDLLAQTQRAAAPDQMVQWHTELKRLRADQRKAESDQASLADNLKNLEGRQNLQQTDVDRLREREQVKMTLRALEKLRPVPAYRVARLHWKDVKEKKRAAELELQRLQQEVDPSLQTARSKDTYFKRIQGVVKARKRVYDRGIEHASSVYAKQAELNTSIDDSNKEIENEKKTQKTSKQERARLEAEIRNLQVRMEHAAPAFNAAEFNERLRELARQIRDLEQKALDENTRQDECVVRAQSRRQRVDELKQQIASLHSQAGQQNSKLKQASIDTHKAWEWVQANRDQFRSEVYGPPVVSCSVKDKRHAAYVESMLGNAEMFSLTVTNGNDFKKLNDAVFGSLRLKDINIRNCPLELSSFKPPIPHDQLKSFGLDSYVLDLLDGPEPVLSMLCDNRNIHAIGVAFQDLSGEQYDALTRSSISSFATPKETYQITRRREYGDAGTSTRTRALRPARLFTDLAVDTGLERNLKAQISELQHEMEELNQQVKQHKLDNQKYGEERQQLKTEHSELATRKNTQQKAKSEFDALPTKMGNLQDKLRRFDREDAEFRDRIRGIQKDIDDKVLTRGQETLNYAIAVSALQKLYTELLEAELLLIEAQSDFETLDARNNEINTLLAQHQTEIGKLDEKMLIARERAQRNLNELNAMMAERSEEEEEIHRGQPDGQTPEELEIEIESLKARLEMVHEGNPHILREFEERGKKIEHTREKLERTDRELVRLEEAITNTRAQWEPQLDHLVSQISEAFGENFARIGAAGQVEVFKHEDFEKWSIQVMVKFRENESLSVLDSHRQSGGERAVSTIFYLMALQSMARAPFRVVDEINQGMDPRNER